MTSRSPSGSSATRRTPGPVRESWRDVARDGDRPDDGRRCISRRRSAGFLQAATQPIAPGPSPRGRSTGGAARTTRSGRCRSGRGRIRLLFLEAGRALARGGDAGRALPTGAGGPNFPTPRPDRLARDRGTDRAVAMSRCRTSAASSFATSTTSRRSPPHWEAGDLDAVSGLQPAEVAALEARGARRLMRYPGTTILAATLNLRPGRTEFQDPAVRKALLEAIDRDAHRARRARRPRVAGRLADPVELADVRPGEEPAGRVRPGRGQQGPRRRRLEGRRRQLDPEGREGAARDRAAQPRGDREPRGLRHRRR